MIGSYKTCVPTSSLTSCLTSCPLSHISAVIPHQPSLRHYTSPVILDVTYQYAHPFLVMTMFYKYPPDGGYGWVIVLLSHFNLFVFGGILQSFGMFLPTLMDQFQGSVTEAVVSFVTSLCVGISLCMGKCLEKPGWNNVFKSRIILKGLEDKFLWRKSIVHFWEWSGPEALRTMLGPFLVYFVYFFKEKYWHKSCIRRCIKSG